jgi:hypothetical protein
MELWNLITAGSLITDTRWRGAAAGNLITNTRWRSILITDTRWRGAAAGNLITDTRWRGAAAGSRAADIATFMNQGHVFKY